MRLIIRHDDFDFRLSPKDYIEVHEQFIRAGLIETAVLQFAQFDNVASFNSELVKYMNNTPNWDIQLHGWQHDEYDKMTYAEVLKDLAASKYLCGQIFNRYPTVWYPPWNRRNGVMEEAAKFMNLTVDNESYDIKKFIRLHRAGEYDGHSLYFHAWMANEREAIPEMLEEVKKYEGR